MSLSIETEIFDQKQINLKYQIATEKIENLDNYI